MKYAREAKEACEIHTDSELWVNVMTKWMRKWKARGWRKKDKKPIQNLDLVKMMDLLYDPRWVKLVWVKAHVGTRDNELADEWANNARERKTFGDIKINEVKAEVRDEENNSEA